MSEWLHFPDYAEVWQCYAHLPIRTMTAEEVMALVSPSNGPASSWPDEFDALWTHDRADTDLLLKYVAVEGITAPIIVGNDGRLWDGHHRLAVAAALGIPIPVRIVPPEGTKQ